FSRAADTHGGGGEQGRLFISRLAPGRVRPDLEGGESGEATMCPVGTINAYCVPGFPPGFPPRARSQVRVRSCSRRASAALASRRAASAFSLACCAAVIVR